MKVTDLVSYFNSQGDEKPAVITAVHKDGTVDLCILSANTRRVPTRPTKEPGTALVETAPIAVAMEVDLVPPMPRRQVK